MRLGFDDSPPRLAPGRREKSCHWQVIGEVRSRDKRDRSVLRETELPQPHAPCHALSAISSPSEAPKEEAPLRRFPPRLPASKEPHLCKLPLRPHPPRPSLSTRVGTPAQSHLVPRTPCGTCLYLSPGGEFSVNRPADPPARQDDCESAGDALVAYLERVMRTPRQRLRTLSSPSSRLSLQYYGEL